MQENESALLTLAGEHGFQPDGLRVLLSVIHGLSMRRSLSGEGPHLDAAHVVGGLWNATGERFGILCKDVMEHWGLQSPSRVGLAVSQLVEAGFLRGSNEEMDDYDALTGQIEWPEPQAPPSIRERSGWGGF